MAWISIIAPPARGTSLVSERILHRDTARRYSDGNAAHPLHHDLPGLAGPVDATPRTFRKWKVQLHQVHLPPDCCQKILQPKRFSFTVCRIVTRRRVTGVFRG